MGSEAFDPDRGNADLMNEVPRYCLVCGSSPVDACHIKSRGAGGTTDKSNIFYACREHHQEQHKIGIITFARKYDQVMVAFIKKGWRIQNNFNRPRFVRCDEAINDEGVRDG